MGRMLLLTLAGMIAAAQTRIDLRTQARGVDFTDASTTKPMKAGTSLPAQCTTGEMFFKTDAPAGNNVYGCAANQWVLQVPPGTVESNGLAVGSRGVTNFMTGPGLMSVISDTGSKIEILSALDTAVVQTQPGEQSGAALFCRSDSGSSTEYLCSLDPAAAEYRTGMVLHWQPDTTAAGGPTTLNVDTLGPKAVKLVDGVSDPPAASIVAGRLYDIWYDGANFRLMGDATPSPHAATHRHGGGDEIAAATPAPNAIPKAGADGKLDPDWLPAGSGGLGYTAENVANKGQPNGYASLDAAGKVPGSQLPIGSGGGAASYMLVFDGNGTTLADGSTVTWSCGSGAGAQCTTTWTVPEGVNWVRVRVWSGGGGGSGSVAGTNSGPGGSGGGYVELPCAVTPGSAVALAVGLGGPGNTAKQDSAGGTSSFGTCATVLGAAAGMYNTASGLPGRVTERPLAGGLAGAGGIATGYCSAGGASGAVAFVNGLGGCGAGGSTGAGLPGGASVDAGGGGGAGATNNTTQGSGGISALGGNGGNGGAWTSGTGYAACTAGSVPGGGGGSAGAEAAGGSNHSGCAGARGEIRVYYAK